MAGMRWGIMAADAPAGEGLSRAARGALAALAFSLPFSIALAQAAAGVALALWLADSVRRGSTSAARSPFLLPLVLFSVVAVVSAFEGFLPSVSVPKLHRLLWYLLAFAIPDLAGRAGSDRIGFVRRLVLALVAGGCVATLLHVVHLAGAMARIPAGMSPQFWLYSQGSMRSPQFHMTAALLLLAGGGEGWLGLRPAAAAAALALNAGGLVLHFKRGVWGAAAGAAALLGLTGARLRWRTVVFAAALASLLVCLPQVRERLIDAPRDFFSGGGRWQLWTQAAPKLMKLAPWGLGYGAMQNADLRHLVRPLEPKISHLHNNALQILVELGWPGLAAWAAWMAVLLAVAARTLRRLRPARGHGLALARGLLAAIGGLLLNGMVEYNFGAGAILMLFALLMGMVVALRDAADVGNAAQPEGPTT